MISDGSVGSSKYSSNVVFKKIEVGLTSNFCAENLTQISKVKNRLQRQFTPMC